MPVVDNNTSPPERKQSPVLLSGRQRSRTSSRDAAANGIYNPFFTGRPRTPTGGNKNEGVDRQEIIRKIKEKAAGRQRPQEADVSNIISPVLEAMNEPLGGRARVVSNEPVLLPSPELDDKSPTQSQHGDTNLARGMDISRPRSALHRGDFRGEEAVDRSQDIADSPRPSPRLPSADFAATSPPAPWHDGFPNTGIHRARRYLSTPMSAVAVDRIRPRAMSGTSLSHSFSYQAPTSPLVNQSNAEDVNDEFLLAQRPLIHDHNGRRRTISPASHFAAYGEAHSPRTWYSPPASLRRESSVPYQAHQPRRSITSLHSLPQSPIAGARRSSGVGSPSLQSSMVGSFEESILKGRMSSTPSRPLDFTAHIGVLGVGDCKPSLKCPPHMIVPFPAVFYSYGHGKTYNDSQPSPYVGLVNLETAAAPKNGTYRRRSKVRATGDHVIQSTTDTTTADDSDNRRRRKQKDKRRSRSPLDEPTGGYRIPPKGQLQIIIKNPNKTAVKLFLVPYDVSDMLPGQKTFIRQRSYSAGPIMDLGISVTGSQERPVLRYLIHLHICCTSKGRFWLYNSIRVVFANRVPDGKEKLRNETQLPEPKYSLYRPAQTSTASPLLQTAQHGPDMAMDVDSPPGPASTGLTSYVIRARRAESHSLPGPSAYDDLFSRQERAVHLPVLETVTSRPTSRGLADEGGQGDGQPPSLSNDGSEGSFSFSRSSSSEKLQGLRTESLLSRKLRDLEMSRARKGS